MFRKNTVILFAILASAFVPYSNVFYAPFVFDDTVISNFLKMRSFTEARFITETTFTLNYLIHGYWLPGYHFVNIAIHAINGVLIYLFMTQTFKTLSLSMAASSAKKYSFFISLLFLTHPLQIQAVTYTSQRYTSLVTLFVLAALNTYVLWRRGNTTVEHSKKKSVGLYISAIIITILSVKVKELAVVLPFLITLVEFMFFSGKIKSRIIYVLPFFLIIPVIIFNALNVSGISFENLTQTQHVSAGVIQDADIVYDVKSPLIANTRMEYILTEFRVIVTYLRMLVLPINLTLVHYYPVSRSVFDLSVIFSLLFLLAIFIFGAVMFAQGHKQNDIMKKLISFGIFWFFIGILPQSSLINKYGWTIFEYRVYLSSLGFFIAVFFLVLHIFRNKAMSVVNYLIAAIIVLSAVTTLYLNGNWQSEIKLWEDNVKKEPLHPVPSIQLGIAYGNAKRFKEAHAEFERASQMEPDFPEIPYQNGKVFAMERQYDKALEQFDKSISINSYLPFTHFDKAEVLAIKNKWPEVIDELLLSLKCGGGGYFTLYDLLGRAFTATGRVGEAIRAYERALRIYSDNAETHNNLGNLYTQTGNFAMANTEILTALKLNPELYEGYNNLGVLYANTGRMTDAVKEFQRALAIKKDYTTGLKNLANAYMGLKMFDDAGSTLKAAIEMNPESVEILTTIGNMHLLKGNKPLAREYYLKALKINPAYAETLRNIELTKTN
ncbi:tetratricopeptide repeat protein [Candidatus Magnetomonas plexicatena]|uniref:tetratricopeptide repeat protein n=1 Tax=Candidatus Magnetomonas plexicatena TaxID=2552947 RepID=UPI00110442C3|nr:tetratricopeptide repeat protein [Nitrospirales bacterium LBB_01]